MIGSLGLLSLPLAGEGGRTGAGRSSPRRRSAAPPPSLSPCPMSAPGPTGPVRMLGTGLEPPAVDTEGGAGGRGSVHA